MLKYCLLTCNLVFAPKLKKTLVIYGYILGKCLNINYVLLKECSSRKACKIKISLSKCGNTNKHKIKNS